MKQGFQSMRKVASRTFLWISNVPCRIGEAFRLELLDFVSVLLASVPLLCLVLSCIFFSLHSVIFLFVSFLSIPLVFHSIFLLPFPSLFLCFSPIIFLHFISLHCNLHSFARPTFSFLSFPLRFALFVIMFKLCPSASLSSFASSFTFSFHLLQVSTPSECTNTAPTGSRLVFCTLPLNVQWPWNLATLMCMRMKSPEDNTQTFTFRPTLWDSARDSLRSRRNTPLPMNFWET